MAKIFIKDNYKYTLNSGILSYGNAVYINPTEEKLLELGFTEKVVEIPIVTTTMTYTPDPIVRYNALTNEKIRKKYSASESEGILRKAIAAGGTTDEFTEFNAYCEQCKTEAKEELGMTETEEETIETEEITTEDEITE